jgi:hypothetical protein
MRIQINTSVWPVFLSQLYISQLSVYVMNKKVNYKPCTRSPVSENMHFQFFNMTIDRGFLEIWKDISPQAFTAEIPFTPSIAFLDGQLHLMRASFMHTWEVFLEVQFVNPLNRLFRWGATTVVLSFDNYKFTPTAKQPTQRRRTTKIPQLEWHEQVSLPSTIPHNYEQLIMNRVFKARVCQYVVANVTGLLDLRNGRRLIVDYDDGALEFTEGAVAPTKLPMDFELGESDVKFAAYLENSDSFLADSIDGDYVKPETLNST